MYKKLLLFHFALLFCFLVLAQKQSTVLITYYSKTSSTAQLARAVAKGASGTNQVQVILKKIEETTEEDLIKADAIILGSPVYNANPAAEVLKFIERWPFEGNKMKNKIGAVFVTGGGISSGEELVQTSLLQAMMVFGMITVGGDEWTSSFGASAVTGEGKFTKELDTLFLQKGERLGKRVHDVVLRWNK
jgi:NAD(P)H dehydrogenase (quinone)